MFNPLLEKIFVKIFKWDKLYKRAHAPRCRHQSPWRRVRTSMSPSRNIFGVLPLLIWRDCVYNGWKCQWWNVREDTPLSSSQKQKRIRGSHQSADGADWLRFHLTRSVPCRVARGWCICNYPFRNFSCYFVRYRNYALLRGKTERVSDCTNIKRLCI